VRRLVDGQFGFQSEGLAVTPQWSDNVHLALGLSPLPRARVYMLWDWGHNPTCVITQIAPNGQWIFLDAMVGDGIGVEELILDQLAPLWQERYARGQHAITHIYDPAGAQREQTSIARSPVMLVKQQVGGELRPGPVRQTERFEPLRRVLTRLVQGMGLVRVDRARAKPVWWALRGGWFFPVARTGLISTTPRKNVHSHPGDATSYGAAVLYPLHQLIGKGPGTARSLQDQEPSYFGSKIRRLDPLEGGITAPRELTRAPLVTT
jgi:hypothetical protein